MKKFLFYLALSLLLIQLYRPEKNTNVDANGSITTELEVPENIQNILERSCNDCHSNTTTYLWYHNIAPLSWVVANHIKEGKEHLNFDDWSNYNADQKGHIIDDLKESIETREMPLVGYLKLHPEAIISDDDTLLLLNWIKSLEEDE